LDKKEKFWVSYLTSISKLDEVSNKKQRISEEKQSYLK